MRWKRQVTAIASKTALGKRLMEDTRYRVIFAATVSLCFHLAYAVYHGVLGLISCSWWFTALWGYYTILGMTRFYVVLYERKSKAALSLDPERFVMMVSGFLLLALGCTLAGVNYMSLSDSIATQYDEITMITIAAYTFCKITMSILRAARQRGDPSPLLATVRRIGYAEVAVSVLTMQRSMLVSFGEMEASKIYLMNALTGAGVYLFINLLGIVMIKESRGKNMEKSKFIRVNEKMAEKVVGTYEKIEEAVVGSYQKIEETVVGGYTKIEDTFVDRYLTKDGETLAEAKERIKNKENTL